MQPLEDVLPPLSFVSRTDDVRVGGRKQIVFGEVEVKDEYNPLYPNDFDEIMQSREQDRLRKKEEEKRKEYDERSKRRREKDKLQEHARFDREQKRWENEQVVKRTTNVGAAIAPPQTLVESDSKILEAPKSPPPLPVPRDGPQKGLGVAAKYMEKFGYKQGQGLGRSEQGMSTALQVAKVGKHIAKIIHEDDIKEPEGVLPPPQTSGQIVIPITDVLKHPTKVVLLRNMVGKGEVDTELEGEIKEECSKYGEILKCVIFEIPDVCDEEAVRTFLEFTKVEQAIKAVVDLHGRFFGGRQILGSFYNLDKFRCYDLGD